ncbi:hypothetical protein FJT64_021404 [Amphibalanus amphitrite]|uniref:Uncharacterized protein n=1 Tax=Amphibalanus amphitrite TaxID=1232801 RepID=A0A6A4WIF2_AMPAM|nr:hypothetical protein FJT64_021404 [Amphibalanus amphitrite]
MVAASLGRLKALTAAVSGQNPAPIEMFSLSGIEDALGGGGGGEAPPAAEQETARDLRCHGRRRAAPRRPPPGAAARRADAVPGVR